MKKFSIKSLKKLEFMVIAAIIIFIALFTAAAATTDVTEVIANIKLITPTTAIALVALSLLNSALRGLRWHFFANKLNLNIPLPRLALYYVSGFALVPTPGKVGTAIRLWFLKKCHNHPYSRTTPLMIMDQLTDFVAIFSLVLAGATIFTDQLLGIITFAILLATMLFLLSQPKILITILDLANNLTQHKLAKIFELFTSTLLNLKQLFSPKLFTGTTLMSIVAWSAQGAALWLILKDMGVEIPFLSACFVFGFSALVGGLTMLPGGLGSAEATMFGLLIALGVTPEVAIATTTISRLASLWFSVSIGFISLPFSLKLAKSNG